MKGAIIGDIIGSAFIEDQRKTTSFQLFKPISRYTDDTILTLSTADAILNKKSYAECLKEWVEKYPQAGYKSEFKDWTSNPLKKNYLSYGDGAARRIAPIGFALSNLKEVIEAAERNTMLTHDLPEKITASKAVAATIFMAKSGASKLEIKEYIEMNFRYYLNNSLDEITLLLKRNFPVSTPTPFAINIFLLSDSFEDAIRKAISVGGPSNTIASITGGIAQAYFKHIPKSIIRRALSRLTPEMSKLIKKFDKKLKKNSKKKELFL